MRLTRDFSETSDDADTSTPHAQRVFPADDVRLYAAAASRNRDVIAAALMPALSDVDSVLEVGSGTGEHVTHFAARTPWVRWTPSDPDARARRSIEAWTASGGLTNVDTPLCLDVRAKIWPVTAGFGLVLSINMVHIAPWDACLGLLAGASRVLRPGGKLLMYGPFHQDGVPTAPSNAEFDAQLRAQNDEWGVRDVADIVAAGAPLGLSLLARTPMPSNNQILALTKG